jgi:hypothetical protein
MKMHVKISLLLPAMVCGFMLAGCDGGGGGTTFVAPVATGAEFTSKVEETFTEYQATEAIFLSLNQGNSPVQIVTAIMAGNLTAGGVIVGVSSAVNPIHSPIVAEWLVQRSSADLPDGIPAFMALLGLSASGYSLDQLIDSSLDDYRLLKEGNAIYIVNDQGDKVEPDDDPKASGISDVNSPPLAHSQSVPDTSISEGGSLNIVLTGTDANGDTIFFELVSNPGNGSLVPQGNFAENGKLQYQANRGFRGADSFTFRVYDAEGAESLPARITVKVGLSSGATYFTGSGTTTVTGNGISCESEAVWRITLSPGGILHGSYENEAPTVPTLDYSAGRYVCSRWSLCSGCTDYWRFSFSGTYDSANGTFVIDSFGYFDNTSRSFIDHGTAIRGRYDDGMIVTDPPYVGSSIGHYFNITQ